MLAGKCCLSDSTWRQRLVRLMNGINLSLSVTFQRNHFTAVYRNLSQYSFFLLVSGKTVSDVAVDLDALLVTSVFVALGHVLYVHQAFEFHSV